MPTEQDHHSAYVCGALRGFLVVSLMVDFREHSTLCLLLLLPYRDQSQYSTAKERMYTPRVGWLA